MRTSNFRLASLLAIGAVFANATDGEANQNAGATSTAPVKTKAEIIGDKIAKAEALLADLRRELEALTKFDNIEVGGTVGFTFGRGEDKKNLNGEVQGVGKLENGVEVVIVLVGKGTLDVAIKRIPKKDLNAYVPPVKVEAVDLVAETQLAQAQQQVGGADSTNVDALLAGA